jgi:RHS repeat-associated protein
VTVTEGDGSQVTAASDGGGGYTLPSWADSTLTQNGDGSWTFVRQQRTTYTFNRTGQLTSIVDLNGYTTTLAYNGSGQLATVTDPEGRTLSFSYGSNGFVSQVSGPDSESVSYGYDSTGNLTSVTDAMNREWQFGYDSNHLLTTLTDPKQQQTVNVYNASAQVTQQTDPAGLVTRFSYSGNNFSSSGGTTTITGPHGEVTVEDYNSGLLVNLTKPGEGVPYYYVYDVTTLAPTAIADPNGNWTTMTYDGSGNMTSLQTPTGGTSYTYNALNEPTKIIDPMGIQTSYTYDADGNVQTKTVTGAGGNPVETTTYGYADSHAGDVTEIQDPAGHVTDYTYDQYGDVASMATHPKSGVSDTTQYVYDVLGRKVCEASPNATASGVSCPAAGQPRVAKTATWVYNADGQVTSATDADGNTTLYAYDEDGNRTKITDPNGNVTQTSFDADSRPTAVTTGYGTSSAATTSYSYDIAPGTGVCSTTVAGAAYCTATTDPSGQTTVDYLSTGDVVIQANSPESGATSSTYDQDNNVLTQTTAAGTATYGYDGDNRVTSVIYSSPASGFSAAANVTYTYDGDNNRTSMTDGSGTTTYTYDSLERLSSVTNGAGTAITYGYDNDGEVTSIGYPSTSRKGGTLSVAQGYDGAGQETSVTDWLGHTTNFSYDADGNITSEAYPNATTATSTFDSADSLLSIADALNSTPNSPFAQMTYTYNPDSQVASEHDTGLPGPGSATYSYDPLSRLTSDGTNSYGYNAAGDPTQLGASTPTVNATHQITSLAQTITRVGTASAGDAGTGSSLSVQLPAGTAPNDQILLAVTLPGNQSIKTTPSGYTLVGKYSSGTTASATQLVVYRRTAQAGDTAASITFSKTFAKAATVIVYSGVDPANPIDTTSSGTTTSGTSITVPSLTTTAANDQLVLAQGALSSTAGTWTAPSAMTTRITQAGGTTIADAISDETNTTEGATGNQTASFSTTGALAAAMIALRPAQTTYTYNPLGARATATTSSGTTSIGYNQAGEMTSYGTATYTYNGDGLRVSKTIGSGSAEAFTYGQAINGSATPPLLIDGTTYYIYGPGGLPLEQVNGSTVFYYLHDQLGSTRALTNSAGSTVATYTYGPYGNVIGQTGTATNPFQFAGAYSDSESDLIYLDARYYDPTTGQFTSVDPLQMATEQPYQYATDDPLNLIDPTGLTTAGVCLQGSFTLGPINISASACVQISSSGDVGVSGSIGTAAPAAVGLEGGLLYEGSNANHISQLSGPFVQAGGGVADGGGAYLGGFWGCSNNQPIYGFSTGPIAGEGSVLQAGGSETGTLSVNLPTVASTLWHGAVGLFESLF